MPTPISFDAAVSGLNEALADPGHADLARSDDGWTPTLHEYLGRRTFNAFPEGACTR